MTATRLPRLAVLVLLLAGAAHLPGGETPEPPLEEAILKAAGQTADGPALLEFFRKRTLSDDELTELAAKVQRLGAGAFPMRQQATRDLIAAGRPALLFLRPALKDTDPERRRRAEQCVAAIDAASDLPLVVAAAHLLSLRAPPGSVEVVLRYLPLADDEFLEDELITVLRVAGIRDGKADPALIAALKDASPLRRAAAAFVLGRLPEARPRVEALLEDADARVRFRAARGLLAGKQKSAVPALVALLDNGPEALAYLAEQDLARIAGEQAPQVWLTAATKDERGKCRAAWEAWWKQHGPDLDVAALDVDQRRLGFTLICCCDGYNDGKGKVWEVDRKGKMRWEINTANYPVDAVMVGNNRVLIAEQSGMCVSERDTQGTVLWKHEVTERLVSCQRLANGNTFLATYTHLFEVTRDHKELYNYTTKHGTIYSAARLANGHIAYLGSENVLAEMDEKGKEVKALKVDASGAGLYKFEPLPGGRFLVGQNNLQKVVEFDGDGKTVWDCPLSNANSVERLPTGNVLACSWADKRVVEVSRGGKVLWELPLGGGPLRIQRR